MALSSPRPQERRAGQSPRGPSAHPSRGRCWGLRPPTHPFAVTLTAAGFAGLAGREASLCSGAGVGEDPCIILPRVRSALPSPRPFPRASQSPRPSSAPGGPGGHSRGCPLVGFACAVMVLPQLLACCPPRGGLQPPWALRSAALAVHRRWAPRQPDLPLSPGSPWADLAACQSSGLRRGAGGRGGSGTLWGWWVSLGKQDR